MVLTSLDTQYRTFITSLNILCKPLCEFEIYVIINNNCEKILSSPKYENPAFLREFLADF